jgi:hypothetical protein
MLTRKGVAAIAGVLTCVAAASWAGPGSVISSFSVYGDFPTGVYRDGDYVYMFDSGPFHAAAKYTPAGNLVEWIPFSTRGRVLEDPDHSYLGSSYISVAVESGVVTYSKAGGAPVRWDHLELIETLGYAHRPGSPYYFIAVWPEEDDIRICRFGTAGSFISSFGAYYGYKMAATERFAGVSGDYLICFGGRTCAVREGDGSLVATFDQEAAPLLYGGTAGPGYPASYGTTLWVIRAPAMNDMVYQIDLGNGTGSAVTPASLGRVKALFR